MIFQFEDDRDFPEYYSKCRKTGTYLYKMAGERQYSDSYFLDEYKNQYAKSYYEDEPGLRNLARRRLDLLAGFVDPPASLLEIGCAAGFFLDEARNRGYTGTGIEISASAAAYGRKLGLEIRTESVYDFKSSSRFAVICAFFVIEHFRELERVLLELNSMLAPGGVFFFAIPSAGGPTFRTNPTEWFKTHPTDHFYDFTPKAMEKTMLSMGLKVVHCSPMSWHRNRDRGIRGKLPDSLYKKLANLTCYGDTIHVIAKKI